MAILKAVLLLVVAFVLATLVKSLVTKLIMRLKLGAALAQQQDAAANRAKTADFVGKLAYLLVFLLFVPGIFESLGLNQVSAPILSLLNTVWGYLPNLLAAGIILWVGFFIARMVRELLIPLFGKIKLNALQEKAGIEVKESAKLSNTLAYIVYVLILIPIIITALQALNIAAISEPAVRMLNIVFEFIPNIIAALVVLVVGVLVSKFSANIVESLIASAGLDAKLSKLVDDKRAASFPLSKIVAVAVQVVMVIFFTVESLGVLKLQVLTDVGSAIIAYMPFALAAVLILAVCYLAASAAEKALRKSNAAALTMVVKVAIYGVGAFMVLNQLHIASELVNAAFILIVAGLAVAFAIAFGVGGRDFASRCLKRFEDKYILPHKKDGE